MATFTTATSLQTPKRSSTTYEKGGNEVSATRAPSRKRTRTSYSSADVSSVVEDHDPFQSSQVPETQFESQAFGSQVPETLNPHHLNDGPPFSQITAVAKTDETARINDFIDHYEMSTKTPTKFTVVVRYLQEEHRNKVEELGLTDNDYRGGGHRLRVTWLQYGKLLQLKLIIEVEAYPDNFFSVLERADKEG